MTLSFSAFIGKIFQFQQCSRNELFTVFHGSDFQVFKPFRFRMATDSMSTRWSILGMNDTKQRTETFGIFFVSFAKSVFQKQTFDRTDAVQ